MSAATRSPGTSLGGALSSSICWILKPISISRLRLLRVFRSRRYLRPGSFQPRAQGRDAECQIVGEFGQELHFLGAERLRLWSIDVNGAERHRVGAQGDGDTRRIAAFQRLGAREHRDRWRCALTALADVCGCMCLLALDRVRCRPT